MAGVKLLFCFWAGQYLPSACKWTLEAAVEQEGEGKAEICDGQTNILEE